MPNNNFKGMDVVFFKDINGDISVVTKGEILNSLEDEGFMVYGLGLKTLQAMRKYFISRNYSVSNNSLFLRELYAKESGKD